MRPDKSIGKAYQSSEVVTFDDRSKIVIISDCHRGDATYADTFAQNQNACHHAMRYYLQNGYTYIELGDGDELWENKRIQTIMDVHSDIFWILSKFYHEGRLYLVYGNHDMVKKSKAYCARFLSTYYDARLKQRMPLFPGIKAHEAICLKDIGTGRELLALHGHQGDLINDTLWKLGRFLVRYLWKPLELFGVNDPTRAGRNYAKGINSEKRMREWVERNDMPLIAGHTHRPTFPENTATPYYNSGSCVHPRCMTAIEIVSGEISLVKWSVCVDDKGILRICRSVLGGPKSLVS